MTQPTHAPPPPRRYSPVLILGITCIVLAVMLAAVSVAAIVSSGRAADASRDARTAASAARSEVHRQDVLLAKVNDIVAGLQAANVARDATSKGQTLALAQVVEGIARGFATPPYPDPDRSMAVEGLCETAASFRAAVGQPPVACP